MCGSVLAKPIIFLRRMSTSKQAPEGRPSHQAWRLCRLIQSPGACNDYYVARIVVKDLHRLGLTVAPEPDPNGPVGHAIIPELSWQAYQADKQRLKQVQVELAKLASTAIVHQPS